MTSLLDLPSEIRLIIYIHLLNPNEYVKSYRKLRDQWSSVAGGPLCTLPRPYVKRYTPSILLLNKKITAEALHYLYRIPLNLYGTPSTYFVMRQMDITEFISEHYLQRIRVGILRLNHANKHFVLPLLDIWGAENRLERLEVYRPKTQLDSQHWKVVESRLGTFSSMVPVVFYEVDNPLKVEASRTTQVGRQTGEKLRYVPRFKTTVQISDGYQ